MIKENSIFKCSMIWVGLPMIMLVLMHISVDFFQLNRKLFFFFNSWSIYTGENLWAILTFFSDGLVSFIILIPFFRKYPKAFWGIFIAAILITILSQGFKRIFDVRRPPSVIDPEQLILIGPDWGKHSYPSGHSAMIFILGSIGIFSMKRNWLRWLLLLFVSIVAISRMVVGVHWPLDVIAGAFVGWTCGIVGLIAAKHTPFAVHITTKKIFGVLLAIASVVLFFADYTGHTEIFWFQQFCAVVFLTIALYENLFLYHSMTYYQRRLRKILDPIDPTKSWRKESSF